MDLLRSVLEDVASMRSRERMFGAKMRAVTVDFERRMREKDDHHQEAIRSLKADHEKEKADLQRKLNHAQMDVDYYRGKSASLLATIERVRVVPSLVLPGDPSTSRRDDRPATSATIIPVEMGDRDASKLHKATTNAVRLTTSFMCSIFEMEDIATSARHEQIPHKYLNNRDRR